MRPVDFAFYFSYSICCIYHLVLKCAFDTDKCLSRLKTGKGGAPGEMELGELLLHWATLLGHCGVVCSQTKPHKQPGAVTGHWVLQSFRSLWSHIALDLWAFWLDSQSGYMLLGCGGPPVQMRPPQGNPGYCLRCCPWHCLGTPPRGCLRGWVRLSWSLYPVSGPWVWATSCMWEPGLGWGSMRR